MPLTDFAFVIKAPGYSPAAHSAKLESALFSSRVVGVSDVSAAFAVLTQMVNDGVQLVELCGGFSAQEAERLREHIGEAIPIGLVTYTPEQEARLATLFS
jgi:hypothetical protein